jgi:hypothetical protein
MRRVESALAPLLLFVLPALGCETTTDTSILGASTTATTSIYLDPSFFMGDTPCAASPGAMQSYVAHLYDATDDQLIVLPASPPVSCSAGVSFRQIAVGRKYRIKIDGYDLPASSLTPLGGASSGSRTMVLESNPDAGPVTPRWSTHCEDVTAEKDAQVNASTCVDISGATPDPGIRIDLRVGMTSAIPALTCQKTLIDPMGNSTIIGDIYAFNVRPEDPSLPALTDLPCNGEGPAPVTFSPLVSVGQTYRFRLEGIAAKGGPVVWGSSCSATAKEGIVVDATCDPLLSGGALDVAIPAEKCAEFGAVTFDVSYAGPPEQSAKGVACGKSVRLSPLPPNKQAAAVVGYRQGGDLAFEGFCEGVIEPGKVTSATCTFL